MSDEARGVLRNAGLLVVGSALLMMVIGILVDYPMLWMDVPLLLVGLALLAYAYRDARRAKRDGRA